MDSYLDGSLGTQSPAGNLVIITGKGRNSAKEPILRKTTLGVLEDEYDVKGVVEESNEGRIVIGRAEMVKLAETKAW